MSVLAKMADSWLPRGTPRERLGHYRVLGGDRVEPGGLGPDPSHASWRPRSATLTRIQGYTSSAQS